MTALTWSEVYYQKLEPVLLSGGALGLHVGDRHIQADDELDFNDGHGGISARHLYDAAQHLRQITGSTCQPQMAYYLFSITRRAVYLASYFPLVNSLDKSARRRFHETVSRVMQHSGFDLCLLDSQQHDRSPELPALVYLVAGQITELFFYRQDILDKLLEGTTSIWLYTDAAAFKADGGVAGGCYNPQIGCLQMVVSRVFEGFNQPTPGVAPLLHEFGHLLDFFNAASGSAGESSSGWLPGMRESDGAIYSPDARAAFIKGKRLEMERYDRQVDKPDGTEPLPIGHPYVFQNNSEFVAGYMELFFRSPHHFAAQNADLYNSFEVLFGQDPRRYWAVDFPFYIEQNRAFYRSGQRPNPSGLTLAAE